MKKHIKYKFTLAELLVSMAVFSILLVIMMQFFTGARTLWTANEKRAALHADATIAMDLMSMLLQTAFYTDTQGTPFAIKNPDSSRPADGWNSRIYFVSTSTIPILPGGKVRYLNFRRNQTSDNVLELLVFSDTSAKTLYFGECFVPYGPTVAPNEKVDEVTAYLINLFDNNKLKSEEIKPILRNVSGLKFTPLKTDGTKITATPHYDLPAGIEIELSLMMDEATVKNWKTAGNKEDFRTKNEYTFRRVVWLGDRTFTK